MAPIATRLFTPLGMPTSTEHNEPPLLWTATPPTGTAVQPERRPLAGVKRSTSMVTCCTFSTHCVIWSAGPPHRLEEERALMCGLQGEERKSKGRAKSKGKAAAYLRQPGGRDEEQGEEGLASRAWSHCLVTSPLFPSYSCLFVGMV